MSKAKDSQRAFTPAQRLTRFLSRVNKNGEIPAHDPALGPCWLWTGRPNHAGYSQFSWLGGSLGHRYSYTIFVMPIPEGLTLDHLCHDPLTCAGGITCPHRACVNPAHLKPTPLDENKRRGNSPASVNARKTHCLRGHEFTPENTSFTGPTKKRRCRACHCIREKARHARRRAEQEGL